MVDDRDDKKNTQDENDPTAPTIAFDYIKSQNFRVIRADGAVGGTTPNGHIHLAFYSERSAIPRRVMHVVKDDGTLGDIREVQTRNSIVREMECDLFLTEETATAIHTWLGERIEELKASRKK